MDSSSTINPLGKEYHVISADGSRLDPDRDVSIIVVESDNPDDMPTLIIDPSSNNNDITVTPAFPSFPTDEEVVLTPEPIVLLESSNNNLEEENTSSSLSVPTSSSSQQRSQLVDELKYLLKPTNSLATTSTVIQESQEVDTAIKRRMTRTEENVVDNTQLLIEELTPDEIKSLGAADRLSFASRSQRSSSTLQHLDRPRKYSAQSINKTRSDSVSAPTILIAQPEPRTFLEHLSGLIWAFLAAYAFTFGVYAYYKGYNLLEPAEHRIAVIIRALLIGIGALTSFIAYYYITLPELSAIRQTQVILMIILSIFVLNERITIPRTIACILTIIGIVVLIRPTTLTSSSSRMYHLNNTKTAWLPYSSSWNHLIGISFVLCTAITYSIASTMNKKYFSTHHLHNTVLCFWSALSALVISMSLVYVTHFVLKDARSFPHDWRLFVGIGLALASIFVFIANQKAIKRERSSIVTLIYSTDIILALILQNLFTYIKSDLAIIIGCILVLASILILCFEVLLIEFRKKKSAIRVAQIANKSAKENDLQTLSSINEEQKPLSN